MRTPPTAELAGKAPRGGAHEALAAASRAGGGTKCWPFSSERKATTCWAAWVASRNTKMTHVEGAVWRAAGERGSQVRKIYFRTAGYCREARLVAAYRVAAVAGGAEQNAPETNAGRRPVQVAGREGATHNWQRDAGQLQPPGRGAMRALQRRRGCILARSRGAGQK